MPLSLKQPSPEGSALSPPPLARGPPRRFIHARTVRGLWRETREHGPLHWPHFFSSWPRNCQARSRNSPRSTVSSPRGNVRAGNYGPSRGLPISRVHVRQSTQKPQLFYRTHPRLRLLLANAYTIHIARSNDAPTRRFQRLSNCAVRPPLLVDRVRCGASVIEVSSIDSCLGCISVVTRSSVPNCKFPIRSRVLFLWQPRFK